MSARPEQLVLRCRREHTDGAWSFIREPVASLQTNAEDPRGRKRNAPGSVQSPGISQVPASCVIISAPTFSFIGLASLESQSSL